MQSTDSNQAKIILLAFILLVIALIAGCGSDDDRTYFIGSVTNSSGSALPANLFREDNPSSDTSGIEICAFGSCDITDSSGGYGFNINRDIFTGGDIIFTFSGRGLDTTALVTNVPGNSEFINIVFTVRDDGSIEVVSVDTDGSSVAPPPPSATNEPQPTVDPGETSIPEVTPTVEPVATGEATQSPFEPTPTAVATPDPDKCADFSGQYTGDGGCRLFSTEVSPSSSGVTLSPFGSNGAQEFNVADGNGASVSTDLILFDLSGHRCDMSCSEGSFTVICRSSAGSCAETFTPSN